MTEIYWPTNIFTSHKQWILDSVLNRQQISHQVESKFLSIRFLHTKTPTSRLYFHRCYSHSQTDAASLPIHRVNELYSSRKKNVFMQRIIWTEISSEAVIEWQCYWGELILICTSIDSVCECGLHMLFTNCGQFCRFFQIVYTRNSIVNAQWTICCANICTHYKYSIGMQLKCTYTHRHFSFANYFFFYLSNLTSSVCILDTVRAVLSFVCTWL